MVLKRRRVEMLNKIIIVFFVSVLATSVYANGYELINLKQQGLVGEQVDGYLSIVDKNMNKANRTDNYAHIQKQINKINKDRKSYYDKTAKQNSVKRTQIEKVFGLKLLEKTKKEGGYIKNEKGEWKSY